MRALPMVLGAGRDLARAWPALLIALLAILTTPHAPWRVLGPLTAALIAGLAVRGIGDRLGRPPSEASARSRGGSPAVRRLFAALVGRGAARDPQRTAAGPASHDAGLRLLATGVLRAGVVVSALRLDWGAIAEAGARPWLIAVVAVVGGLFTFALLSRALGARGTLAALVAIGTSVCGAAAIAAASPRLRARDEDVTLAIAVISVLGAAFSVGFVLLQAWTGLGAESYALLSGGALHEVAHVVAAGSAVPATSDLALLTKLARVAMLPIGLLLLVFLPDAGRAASRGTDASPSARGPRIPGLAIAFFVVSLLGSVPGWLLPEAALESWLRLRGVLLGGANIALAASMAAIGLRLAPRDLIRTDRRTLALALLGAASVVLLVVTTLFLTG